MSERKVQIFRAADAPSLVEAGCMSVKPVSPVQRAGMDKLIQAGFLEGDEIKVLVNIPGFSLTYVWFKKDYPLPLHSHDADCLYYVIAGSIEFGAETLGPRDSFFLPAGAAYTYKPGPDGVEVLEFRHANQFDFVNLARNEAFYEKAAALIAENRDGWRTAVRPTAAG